MSNLFIYVTDDQNRLPAIAGSCGDAVMPAGAGGCGERVKADMTLMLSDMLQASFSKFASQFNPSSGGQGDTAPAQTAQTVASEPTVDVASNDDDSPHRGPEDQSEGEVTDSEGEPADPTATGLPTLEQLKMSEEEQREYDAFSLSPQSLFLHRLNVRGGL